MVINLLIATSTIAICLTIQTIVVALLMRWLSRLENHQALQLSLGGILSVLLPSMFLLLFGNIVQTIIWAGVFLILGEFESMKEALYHSIVNFSTLGYGDLVMSAERRLLGAFEAINGILMFGLTTSTLYAVLRGIIRQARLNEGKKPVLPE